MLTIKAEVQQDKQRSDGTYFIVTVAIVVYKGSISVVGRMLTQIRYCYNNHGRTNQITSSLRMSA